MDCANDLIVSVFYNRHVCFYPLSFTITQMLPLAVTAQGTRLHFSVNACSVLPVKAPPVKAGGPEAPQEAKPVRKKKRDGISATFPEHESWRLKHVYSSFHVRINHSSRAQS